MSNTRQHLKLILSLPRHEHELNFVKIQYAKQVLKITKQMQHEEFSQKFKFLVDFYAIDFITLDYWQSLPEEFKLLENFEFPEICRLFDFETKSGIPAVDMFINDVNRLSIQRVPKELNLVQFSRDILMGMNPKKLHEIGALAIKIHELASLLNVTHILDIGGGQGYLSSVLGLEFGYQVIALDANAEQIRGGKRRIDYITELFRKHKLEINGFVGFKLHEIDIEEDYDKLIMSLEFEYGFNKCNWMVVGLHCCGDLSVSMIKGFCKRKNSRTKALFSVGCCYQLLSESEYFEPNVGFPMSLKPKLLNLGICRKMLACQPPYKMLNLNYFKESIRKLFYRAVLQKILVDFEIIPKNEEFGVTMRREKKLAIKKMGAEDYKTFVQYCKAALKKLGVEDAERIGIEEYYETYECCYKQIAVVWTLRAMMGNILEGAILSDRLEFVQEAGLKGSLEPVMDPTISPRNMALIVT